MALDQITSQSIADNAISAGDISNGSITAAKLHTTAIQDKLGYTPVSPTQLTTEINNLISSAPGALNTLDELAAALGDDANFATTVTNTLATKANTSSLGTLATVSPTGTPDSTKFLRGDNSWQVVAVTPTAISDQDNSSTGYFMIPKGTTAQRPSSPVNGMTRYNTTINQFEVYQNGIWTQYSVGYTVEYLVVAGGGAGGNRHAGGGGAGGYISSSINVLSNVVYPFVIGAGGSTVPYNTNATNSGNNSTAFGVTAIGGGAGGTYADGGSAISNGQSGGSGGGGANISGLAVVGSGAGGAGTAGQGNNGGSASGGPNWAGAGGGGAGAAGTGNSSNDVGGNGGAGLQWLNGSYYAGGGGGGYGNTGYPSYNGGIGGGGQGDSQNNGNATNGTANTGGGGGGSRTFVGGAGGSGVVIVRYTGSQRGTGGTVTSSGGYTYHTFTSSGSFTA